MIRNLTPVPLRSERTPFDHPDWVFELKYDGFRALAYIENGRCRLVSRNGHPFSAFWIAYFVLMKYFAEFVRAIWSEPQWKFRAPATIEEASQLVDLQLRTIGTLFQISNYPAPYIGGDVQIERLPAPPDSIAL